MEEWRDQAIVLSARPHGESGAVVSLLTENQGQHAGYVRGGLSSKMRAVIEPGTLVSAQWQARTADNLGNFSLEPERSYAAALMGDSMKLNALIAACRLCHETLPEREKHEAVFHGLSALLETMTEDIWAAAYVMWEIALLKELGFGLELTQCAGGGDPATLAYVSPRTGRAVSAEEGAPYKERLLPLPAFLTPARSTVSDEAVLEGLELTGYFLQNRVFAHHSRGLPEERTRFAARFAQALSSVS